MYYLQYLSSTLHYSQLCRFAFCLLKRHKENNGCYCLLVNKIITLRDGVILAYTLSRPLSQCFKMTAKSKRILLW